MKLKRIVTCILAGVLTFTLSACGGDSKKSETSGGNKKGDQLTDGIWGGSDAELDSMEELKKGFEEKTGATLEYKVYTDLNTQIQADFIGKTAPDVFYVNAEMFPFYGNLGVMEPLDPDEVQAEQFHTNLIEAFTNQDGELMALPKDVSTLALYYNEDLLAEAGYTAEDIPEDLEAFKSFLPELQEKMDSLYGNGEVTAMTYNQDLARMIHILEASGDSISDEEDRATLTAGGIVKNMEFLTDLINSGGLKTPSEMGLGWNGEVFGTGKTVLMEEGNWVYTTLLNDYSDINFGVTSMPTYEGEIRSMNFTVGYGIYSGSENKELAKEWIKYATGTEGMATWCKGAGTLPSREDVKEAIQAEDDEVWAVHLEMIPYSIAWQQGENLVTINNAFQNFIPSAIKGEATVEEALGKAEEQANKEIENAQ